MAFFTAGEVGCRGLPALYLHIHDTLRGYKVRPYAGETVENSSWNREQWWIICASIVSPWNNDARQACVNWPVSASTFLLSVRADNWIGSTGSVIGQLLIDCFAPLVLFRGSSMQFWEAIYLVYSIFAVVCRWVASASMVCVSWMLNAQSSSRFLLLSHNSYGSKDNIVSHCLLASSVSWSSISW